MKDAWAFPQDEQSRPSVRKVVVIGAGVAGLQTAKHLLAAGFHVLILEACEEVGGVWLKNYPGYGLQVPYDIYQFPDFPYPAHLTPKAEYPSGQEVLAYIKEYAKHFGLYEHIKLSCQLLHLRQLEGSTTWVVLYQDMKLDKFFQFQADFAVISTGLYSRPNMPFYKGMDTFKGVAVHSKDFHTLKMLRGRDVLLVGGGKTALDCVAEAATCSSANSVMQLYRQSHWPVPRTILGISIRSLLFNHAITKAIPPYYTAGPSARIAAAAAKPLQRAVWWGLEKVIKTTFKIQEDRVPVVKLPLDLFYGGQILDSRGVGLDQNEKVTAKKGEIACFTKNGAILQDGSFVNADVVVFCTGYTKTYDYLSTDIQACLDLEKDGLYLYRNMISARVPNLCFIGAEVSTYNNILTHGIQALWLVKLLRGQVQLPPMKEMQDDVAKQIRWRRQVMPVQRHRGSVLMLYMQAYHDQLISDMGHNPNRKGHNPLKEWFCPYLAADYKPIFELEERENLSYALESRKLSGNSGGIGALTLALGTGSQGDATKLGGNSMDTAAAAQGNVAKLSHNSNLDTGALSLALGAGSQGNLAKLKHDSEDTALDSQGNVAQQRGDSYSQSGLGPRP